MKVELTYMCAACNRVPKCCDWGLNGLICYGSCHSVIISNPKVLGISKDAKVLNKHTDRVNSVKWIRTHDYSSETEIVSTSNDGTIIVWTLINDSHKFTVLKGHSDGVNIAEGIYTNSDKNSLIIASASIDSTCRLWKRTDSDDFSLIQVFNFGRGLCLALTAAFLPKSNIILLACAKDDSQIHLYAQTKEETDPFKLITTLKGHENWVNGLDFTTNDEGNLLLASGSQDSYIRIWRVCSIDPPTTSEIMRKDKMHVMEYNFSVSDGNEMKFYSVFLETVINGHEGWIYDVRWHPKISKDDGSLTQPMKLLSSSLDKSMLIWTLDELTKFWTESVRVGDVGGNTLGFYGSTFSPDGFSILGYSYCGAFHLWNYSEKITSWEPGVIRGGHFDEVVDLDWEPQGAYLITVSLDQTTRIHVPWVRENEISWHELARPQIHGHNMSCVSIISRYKFVSGADEKISRVFAAPINFISNFKRICNLQDDKDGDLLLGVGEGPKGASVPSLGLSNKAVFDSSNEEQSQPKGKELYPEDSYFHEIQLNAPPTESTLLQNTLWPEIQKLYGHGYEIFSLAASHDGAYVASASKASSYEYAAIILWDVKSWQQKQKLFSHTLTVTSLMFSPDDNALLSISRDRRWSIFEKNPETNEYNLTASTDKKNGIHTRIIWCCAWSPDSRYFATGSRDGKVVIWRKNLNKQAVDSLGQYEAAGDRLDSTEAVTAIAFAPILIQNNYLLCLGFESGLLVFYKWGLDIGWQHCCTLNQNNAHHLTVKKISFRPKVCLTGDAKTDENILQVASCSSDYSVKIFNVFLN